MELEMNSEAGEYLTFALEGETYAVSVSQVEVVLEMQPVTRVPNTLPHLRGVINYRGSVIPVVDLRIRFGLAPSVLDEGTSIVVLQLSYEGDTVTVGMLADGVEEVVRIDPESLEKVPGFGSRLDERILSGIAKRGSGFVIILDINKAFESMADVLAQAERA